MYGDNPESLLPDNIVMKVVDFKDKVELRLKYKGSVNFWQVYL